jgi:hypothetical protein
LTLGFYKGSQDSHHLSGTGEPFAKVDSCSALPENFRLTLEAQQKFTEKLRRGRPEFDGSTLARIAKLSAAAKAWIFD